MSVVGSGQMLCIAALAEATWAATVIPAAWPLVVEIGLLYSDPGQMEQAAHQWKDAAAKLETLKNDVDQLAKGVPPEKWTGKDRGAFHHAVDEYKAELTKVHDFHGGIGDMLQTAAYVYFAAAVLAFTLASMLAVQAVAIVAASWTVVGAAAIEAAANAMAGVFDTITTAATLSIKVLIGAIVGLLAAGGVVYTMAKGKGANPTGQGPVSFKKATLGPISLPPTTA